MKKQLLVLSLILLTLLTVSCDREEVSPGITFDHNGTERTYYLHVPDNLPANSPLVFYLHGYRGNASEHKKHGFDVLADANGFSVVYPQGLKDNRSTLNWNAGFDSSNIDDVGFLSALAKELQTQYNLSPSKTFTSGTSIGGWMSYQLVYKRPDVFKAASSIIGRMGNDIWSNRNDVAPVPILQISGAIDQWQNDYTNNTIGGWGGAPDMQTQIDFWATLNATTTTEITQVTSNTTATKYKDGINGNQVWYYVVDRMGHEIPFGKNDRINALEVTWEFFSNY